MWECAAETDADDVREMMKKTPGVIVFDKNVRGGYVTLNDVQGRNRGLCQPFASGRFDRKRFQLLVGGG